MLNLNRAISTPLAIGVILVLSILVGGITLWQVSETKKEDFSGGEINIPEKDNLPKDWKNYRLSNWFQFKYPKDWNPNEGGVDYFTLVDVSNNGNKENPDCSFNIIVTESKYLSGILRPGELTEEIIPLNSFFAKKLVFSGEFRQGVDQDTKAYLIEDKVEMDGHPETLDLVYLVTLMNREKSEECSDNLTSILNTFDTYAGKDGAFLGVCCDYIMRLIGQDLSEIGVPKDVKYGCLITDQKIAEQLKTGFCSDAPSGIYSASPAQDILLAKDVITEINGRRIVNQIGEVLNDYDPGDKVSVVYIREGTEYEVEIELIEKPKE